MRHCTKCKRTPEETDFRITRGKLARGYKDGWCYFPMCKECEKVYKAEWYTKNRERERVKRKAHYQANKQQYINRVAKRIGTPEYQEYQRLYQHRRRESSDGDLTIDEWEEILEEFNHCCAYCLQPFEKLEMEHMVPLTQGGHLTRENIVPACHPCNASKNARNLLEFVVYQVEIGI